MTTNNIPRPECTEECHAKHRGLTHLRWWTTVGRKEAKRAARTCCSLHSSRPWDEGPCEE